MAHKSFTLYISAYPSVTLLPRCLQILSRRSFTLNGLQTETQEDGTILLHCDVTGPEQWEKPLIHLLARCVDVIAVSDEPAVKS